MYALSTLAIRILHFIFSAYTLFLLRVCWLHFALSNKTNYACLPACYVHFLFQRLRWVGKKTQFNTCSQTRHPALSSSWRGVSEYHWCIFWHVPCNSRPRTSHRWAILCWHLNCLVHVPVHIPTSVVALAQAMHSSSTTVITRLMTSTPAVLPLEIRLLLSNLQDQVLRTCQKDWLIVFAQRRRARRSLRKHAQNWPCLLHLCHLR